MIITIQHKIKTIICIIIILCTETIIIIIIINFISIISIVTIVTLKIIIITLDIIIIATGTLTVQFDGANHMTIDRRREVAAEAQDITLRFFLPQIPPKKDIMRRCPQFYIQVLPPSPPQKKNICFLQMRIRKKF